MSGDSLPTPFDIASQNTWGTQLNQYLTDGMKWYFPEQSGTLGQGNDGAIMNALIQKIQGTGRSGLVMMDKPMTIEQTVQNISAIPIHMVWTNGAMNRQAGNAPTFIGARWNPAVGFSGPLLQLGFAGNQATNPVATRLFNPCFNGRASDGSFPVGSVGISLSDTSDVVLEYPQIANFDPTTNAGVAVFNVGTASVAAAGLDVIGGVIQNCGSGIVEDGIGATDFRIIGTLFRLCANALNCGPSTTGGGGGQIQDCHFVFGAATAGMSALKIGQGGADNNIQNCYFDTYGTAIPVQITPRNVAMVGNHFLASGNCAGPLVTYSAATARFTFTNNWADANASAMTALLKFTGFAGAPPAGVVHGNFVYNHTGSLIATVIDNANAAVPATNTATTYVQGNVAE